MRNVVAVVVGVPGRVLTSARFLPGNLIARRSLLRTNWRPSAIWPVYKISTAKLQRGARPTAAVEVILVAALNEPCRTSRLDFLTRSWRWRRRCGWGRRGAGAGRDHGRRHAGDRLPRPLPSR